MKHSKFMSFLLCGMLFVSQTPVYASEFDEAPVLISDDQAESAGQSDTEKTFAEEDGSESAQTEESFADDFIDESAQYASEPSDAIEIEEESSARAGTPTLEQLLKNHPRMYSSPNSDGVFVADTGDYSTRGTNNIYKILGSGKVQPLFADNSNRETVDMFESGDHLYQLLAEYSTDSSSPSGYIVRDVNMTTGNLNRSEIRLSKDVKTPNHVCPGPGNSLILCGASTLYLVNGQGAVIDTQQADRYTTLASLGGYDAKSQVLLFKTSAFHSTYSINDFGVAKVSAKGFEGYAGKVEPANSSDMPNVSSMDHFSPRKNSMIANDKVFMVEPVYDTYFSFSPSDVIFPNDPNDYGKIRNLRSYSLELPNIDADYSYHAPDDATWFQYNPSTKTVFCLRSKHSLSEIDVNKGKTLGTYEIQNAGSIAVARDGVYVLGPEKNDPKLRLITLPSRQFSLPETAASLKIGETYQIKPQCKWSLNYSYASSSPQTATVSSTGKINALNPGNATITVTAPDGSSKTLQVTVTGSPQKAPAPYNVPLEGKGAHIESLPFLPTFGSCRQEFLYPNGSGSVRVETQYSPSIKVFAYDSQNKLTFQKEIALKLPLFGTFYAGEKYNYVVSGDTNLNESSTRAVLNITAYTKDWKEAASRSISDINTTIPFDAGAADLCQAGNKLILHTCHEMYKSEDGLNHQSNMSFSFDANSLKVLEKNTDVNLSSTGFVSHSFNEYVRTDGKDIFRADHSDANPRALVVTKAPVNGSINKLSGRCEVFPIAGERGENYTGVYPGGFEISSSNCLFAGAAQGESGNNPSAQENVFVAIASKTMSSPRKVWLTSYSKNDGVNIHTVQLAKANNDTFVMLWEEVRGYSTIVKAVGIDEDGNKITDTVSLRMHLSTCTPVQFPDGTIRWTSTDSNGQCTMHVLHPKNITNMDSSSQIMHRLYNPNSGEHFYTANTSEKDYLAKIGWKYEGTGWTAPSISNTPVYRLYNKNAGDHHYTMNAAEKDYLVRCGWNYEGIGWYSDDAQGVPLYRQYNPNAKAGSHNYTTNKKENDYLVKIGWRGEGVGWYGLKQ